jgi:hypothetical protein
MHNGFGLVLWPLSGRFQDSVRVAYQRPRQERQTLTNNDHAYSDQANGGQRQHVHKSLL